MYNRIAHLSRPLETGYWPTGEFHVYSYCSLNQTGTRVGTTGSADDDFDVYATNTGSVMKILSGSKAQTVACAGNHKYLYERTQDHGWRQEESSRAVIFRLINELESTGRSHSLSNGPIRYANSAQGRTWAALCC